MQHEEWERNRQAGMAAAAGRPPARRSRGLQHEAGPVKTELTLRAVRDAIDELLRLGAPEGARLVVAHSSGGGSGQVTARWETEGPPP